MNSTTATCSVAICDRPAAHLDLCLAHYGRLKRTGDVNADVPIRKVARGDEPSPTCSVDGCEEAAHGRGWCASHYARWVLNGDVNASKPLRAKARSWDGVECSVERLEHHMVMEESIGRCLIEGETVHHRNGIRHDNRLENLELWSKNHPNGIRVTDMVAWAYEVIEMYKDVVPLLESLED